ncbi:ankyrin repeat-containing domain protein [Podospora fimiseda]|uniref:Ankyrin repeat-containing domain protein n=1 Tax=Podospora fimiseda TaxID=252190 RepID=A0AAN6YT08_9PEZI|nr:ankyrin repeat-containing domain protein [Podospora fimiseda]
MSPLIVLVNGLGDDNESKVDDTPAPVRFFAEHFPGVDVELFDVSRDRPQATSNNDYLREGAKNIIQRLQHLDEIRELNRDLRGQRTIIFLAHNTGAALVKQALLLASEDYRHQWISSSTIALYFIESPSYTDHHQWEQFLVQLHSTNKIPLSNLSALVNFLPRALARVEIQFSAISHTYDIKTFNSPDGRPYPTQEDLWYFQDDGSRMDPVLEKLRGSLRGEPVQLQRNYQFLQDLLSRPEASINRVTAITPDQYSMKWLEKQAAYQSWLDDSGSAVLGITGPPGSGSTHLSSHILHMLLSGNRDSKAIFLSFSFYRWDARRNSERSLVTSLIRQLLMLRPGFFRRMTEISDQLLRQPSVSCVQLWALFCHLLAIPRHSRVFLVLNAVDQCLQPISNIICQLTATTSMVVPLKVVTTSLKPLDIPPGVSFRGLSLEDSSWKVAIRSMATERAAQIVNVRPVWKVWEDRIANKLCSGDYTYLYVMLNLEVLEHSKLPSTRDALQQLLMAPVLSTESVFGTLVSGLHESELGKLAINWIYHTARPLTVQELAVALALGIEPLEEPESRQRLTFDIVAETVSWDLLRDIGGILGGAIKVSNDRVLLVHSTLRDYLKDHSDLLIPNFHATITWACLKYISLYSAYSTEVSSTDHELEPPLHIAVAAAFLEYAELYWMEHYKHIPSPSPSLDDQVDLDNEVRASVCVEAGCYWRPLFLAAQLELGRVVDNMIAKLGSAEIEPQRLEKAANIAARTGNLAILEALLKVSGSHGLLAALKTSAEYGHTHIVENLIARMDAESVDSLRSTEDDSSPLLLATSNGHTDVVKVLLTQGLSMRVSDSSGNSPVHLAAAIGDTHTLRVLREQRPNDFEKATATGNRNSQRPIHLACKAGSIEAFDLLLSGLTNDQLTERTQSQIFAMNLVQLAAESGHLAILKKLIIAGGDTGKGYPDLVSLYNSPLYGAAQNGHLDVVECLFDEVEKLLACTGDSEKEAWRHSVEESLESAVMNGHGEVVKFLIKNSQRNSRSDWNCLLGAIRNGHLDILKTLVDAGMSVHREADYNETLDAAIGYDFPDIVRFLVDKGLSPQWDGAENSLHYAVRTGRIESLASLREVLRKATRDDLQRANHRGLTPLQIAAETNSLVAFKAILACEEKLRAASSEKPRRSPKTLWLVIQSYGASKKKRLEFIQYLLDNQWKADAPDRSSDIPLHAAIENIWNGDDVVELLLSRGADPDGCDKQGRSALHIAVSNERASMVALLLLRGANPDLVDDDGFAPLHNATQQGNEHVVRVLLGLDEDTVRTPVTRATANIDLKGPRGWKAIHYAHGSPAVTRCLLEGNPGLQLDEVVEGNLTPLMLASRSGADDVVGQLLDAGAKPDLVDSKGRSALHYVADREDGDHPESAKSLLEHDADPNIRANDQSTALSTAITRKNMNVARVLLDAPAINPNIYGGTLHSSLQAAASVGDVDITNRLLKAGADPRAHGGAFNSPLHAAAYADSIELVDALLEAGADASFDAPPFGTPLSLALATWTEDRKNFCTIATLLVHHDASVNIIDSYSRSPVMNASAYATSEEVQHLLKLGANLNTADSMGATPLHYALRNENNRGAVVKFLLANGANAAAQDKCNRSVLYLAAMTLSDDLETFTSIRDAVPVTERKAHLEAALPAALKAKAWSVFDQIMKEEEIRLNVPDRSGWTALDVAHCYVMLPQSKMLEERGATKGITKEKPTRLSLFDRNSKISLSEDGREAWMNGGGVKEKFTATGAVRANHCIPMDDGIFYFEVEVLEYPEDFTVAVGLLQENSWLHSLCGWLEGTWGYHSDDGSILSGDDVEAEGPPYGRAQVVGVTFDAAIQKVQFTLDGEPVGKVFEKVIGQWYPAVSFQVSGSETVKVRVNFGENDCRYKPVTF